VTSLTTKVLVTDAEVASDAEEFALVYVLNSWGEGDSKHVSLPSLVEEAGDQVQQAICQWIQLLKAELHTATSGVLHEDPLLAELHPLFEGNYAITPEHFELAQLIVLCRSLNDRDVAELIYTILSRWRGWLRLIRSCQSSVPLDGTKLQDITTAFVDYLVADPIDTYWPALRNLAVEHQSRYLFVHQFTKHQALPTVTSARARLGKLQDSGEGPCRALLENAVNLSDLFQIREHTALLRRVGRFATTISPPMVPYMSGLQPLDLYSEQLNRGWNDSTVIDTAMRIVAFNNILSLTPHLRQVIYLQENHRWEKVLLREATKRQIATVGVPHTVVRPRDLRYHLIAHDSQSDQFLFPNIIATNGPATRDELAAGIAGSRLISIEAQRYQSLLKIQRTRTGANTSVLIAGDLLPEHTQFILDVALPVLRQLNLTVNFKPHPADIGSRSLAEAAGATIVDGDFQTALSRTSLLIAGSLTAASAEAVHVGIPVITLVDPSHFNLSPLLRLPFARFARTPLELRNHLEQLLSHDIEERREMFTIDDTLVRWRRLLSVE
jgi:surface carbohydrate biosynthesis protein (TIGR04326 family)